MIESNLIQDISALKKLPNSWSVIDFGEVFTDISGGNKKFLKSDFLVEGKVAVVDQGKDLIAGYTNEEDEVVKGQPPYIVFGDHTRIFKYIDFPFVMGADGTKVFKVKDITINDEKYLFHFLNSLNIPNTGYNRHFKYLKSTKIPLPPLPQQQKIANILDAADALRQNDKALIAKYDELTQALFLDMFGDPVSNPKRWEKVRFDELVSKDCPLTYGIVQPGEEYDGGVPCVKPVDLVSQYIKVDNLKMIDPVISSKFKRTLLKGGELLLSVRGSVGVISIAHTSIKGSNVTRGIVPIWFDNNISNKLFFYYLYNTKEIQREVKSLARGATLIQINLKDLRGIEIIKPSLNLQNLFAERVAVIEEQKAIAQKSLEKSEELFNSLLQKAFKGELV